MLLIRTLGTNFSEILNEIRTFSFKKMHLKTSSAKWLPFCLGLNVFKWFHDGCSLCKVNYFCCNFLWFHIFRYAYCLQIIYHGEALINVIKEITSQTLRLSCSYLIIGAFWAGRITVNYGLPRNVHDDAIKWKYSPRYWPFVRGIHRSPVNSPHKGQWRGALRFSLICVWINGWANNHEAGDLRRYDDITVMRVVAYNFSVFRLIHWGFHIHFLEWKLLNFT